MSNAPAPIWLTQEAYDRLRAELDELSGPGRKAIAHEIEEARAEGDLRENGGYHAAKEEQGKREARIRQLQELLLSAQVGSPPVAGDSAGPGMIVTVRFDGEQDSERFLIGSREDSGHAVEVYSAASPLGRALTGRRPGETVSYEAPGGRQMRVELLAVEPYTG